MESFLFIFETMLVCAKRAAAVDEHFADALSLARCSAVGGWRGGDAGVCLGFRYGFNRSDSRGFAVGVLNV